MKHTINFDKPAKLIRGKGVSQFGDGYRQVTGPTVAEGSVDELLGQVSKLPRSEASQMYFVNSEGGGNPLSFVEVTKLAAERA